MRKTLYILLIVFLSRLTITAQDTSKDISKLISPKVNTPEASALMRYVDYPTNLYTGLVDIEIPLYEIVEGDLRLPISLKYHASGLKLGEHDGRFGAGWSLNAAPQLQRSVNGERDERGYLIEGDKPSMGALGTWVNVYRGSRDAAPDNFYYSLTGKSGKFNFCRIDGKTHIQTRPYDEGLKADYDISNGIFNSMSLKDESGATYEFDCYYGNTLNGNNTNQSFPIQSITSANGKHKIYFVFKGEVKYYRRFSNEYLFIEETLPHTPNAFPDGPHTMGNYQQFKELEFPFYTIGGINRQESYKIKLYKNNGTDYNDGNDEIYDGNEDIYAGPYAESMSTYANFPIPSIEPPQYTIEKPLYKISTDNISVEFVGEETLTSIIIKRQGTNTILREIRFHYKTDYFKHLTKIEILEGGNEVVEKYGFTYNQTAPIEKDRTQFNAQSDHWGYYNGMPGQSTLPIDEIRVVGRRIHSNSSDDKQLLKVGISTRGMSGKRVDSDAMQMGILTSITYPTGRQTTFTYEPHRYLHDYSKDQRLFVQDKYDSDLVADEELPENEEKEAGGLRIKQIDEYDPISENRLRKEFKYGENEDGLGIIGRQISEEDYGYTTYRIRSFDFGVNGWFFPYITRVRAYNSTPLPYLFENSGSSTVYRFVTEYTTNVDTGEKYKSIYTFITPQTLSIKNDNRKDLSPLYYVPDESGRYGQLIEKIDYKLANGDYVPVLRKDYSYTMYEPLGLRADHYKVTTNILFGENFQDFPNMDEIYSVVENIPVYVTLERFDKSYTNLLRWEKTVTYDQTGTLQTSNTINYKYNYETLNKGLGKTFLAEKSTTNSNGVLSTEKYTYPFHLDYVDAADQTAQQMLIEKNQIKTIIKKEATNGVSTNISRTKFKIDPTSGLPLPVSVITNTGENRSDETRLEVMKYDSYGNPMHMVKDGNINTTYLWGYFGRYLIAEIQNATFEQIKNILGNTLLDRVLKSSTPSDADYNTINNLRTNVSLSNTLISTYKYDPIHGVTEVTDPSGKTAYYEYDNLGRLVKIKDTEKNVINEYKYSYSEKWDPMTVELSKKDETEEDENPQELNITLTTLERGVFVVTPQGGSGSFSYDWKLTDSFGTIIKAITNTTSQEFTESITEEGVYMLYCIVKDLKSGKSTQVYKRFIVEYPTQIEFSNIKTKHYGHLTELTAEIYSPSRISIYLLAFLHNNDVSGDLGLIEVSDMYSKQYDASTPEEGDAFSVTLEKGTNKVVIRLFREGTFATLGIESVQENFLSVLGGRTTISVEYINE